MLNLEDEREHILDYLHTTILDIYGAGSLLGLAAILQDISIELEELADNIYDRFD